MQQVPSPSNPPVAAAPKAESTRTFWIYTGYVAATLGLLGVLAYHFSRYVMK